MEWRGGIGLVGIDIEGRGRVGLARGERGFDGGEAAFVVTDLEQLGGGEGAPEHGVGAGHRGVQAEQVDGADLDEAEDAVDRAEALVEVIGALEGLLTPASEAAESSCLGGLCLVVGVVPEAERLAAHGGGATGRAVAGARGAGWGPSNT